MAGIGRLLGDRGPIGRSLATVVIATAWVSTWRPQVDPDAWWHLARGESILMNGVIPTVESSSWLTEGQRLISHSWLWDVLLALSYRIGEATGTSLLVLPVTAVIVALIWLLLTAAAPDIPPVGRAALVLVATVAALPLWAPRGQTLDVAFVLAITWIIWRYLRHGSGRLLFGLPILGIAWANLHGSAILGLVGMVVVTVVAGLIAARWGLYPVRRVGPVLVAGLAGIAATAINPYGLALLAYPFDRSVASAFSPAIVEWRPPDFGALELLPYRLLLVAVVMAIIGGRHRITDPFLVLAAAGWTFAALGAARFVTISAALLVVVIGPAMVASLAALAGRLGGDGADGADEGDDRQRSQPTSIGRGPSIALTSVAIGAILAVGWTIIQPSAQFAAIERRSPVAAVAALESIGCDGRLLPDYGWAGYVLWATDRQVGAYGDSAAEPLRDQFALETLRVDPRPWLDDHGVDVILMTSGSALARWLHEADDWRLAYDDGQATIHVRSRRPDCQFGA